MNTALIMFHTLAPQDDTYTESYISTIGVDFVSVLRLRCSAAGSQVLPLFPCGGSLHGTYNVCSQQHAASSRRRAACMGV